MDDGVLYNVLMTLSKPDVCFTEFVMPGKEPAIGSMYVGKIVMYEDGDVQQFHTEPKLAEAVCQSVERRMWEIKRGAGGKRPVILPTKV
jgi:hypothetical protein